MSRAEAAKCLEYELTSDDLLVANMPKPKRTIQVALDSGAGDNVAGPQDVEGLTVVESEGSRSNRHFVAANGQKIANEGQVHARMHDGGTESTFDSVFQIASVSRPLYSVSRLCDHGAKVIFDKNEGRVVRNGKVVSRFPRKGGLYVADLDLSETPAADFAGQGSKA
jgi:hypothetical protein